MAQFDFKVMHTAGKTNINANLISRVTHMDDPLSDKDSITQDNQDMFPLPWKQLKVGEKPNLIKIQQSDLLKINNCSSSKYLPPHVQVRYVPWFNHLGICQGPVQTKGVDPF